MRRFLGLILLFILPTPVPASDFDWLVREFSRESGAQQTHIPFLGFANFIVKVARPAGTSDFKLAVFERPGLGSLRFNTITDATVGSSWRPVIRVRSIHGDSTNIYGRDEGKHLSLLIATLDQDDATFVQVRIKPEALMHFIDEHDLHHRR
jgi:hypothetical protein